MTAKSPSIKKPAEQVVKDIRRATRRISLTTCSAGFFVFLGLLSFRRD